MPKTKKKFEPLSKLKTYEEILRNIPEYFYAAFTGELVSVFSISIFDKDDDNTIGLAFCTGTSGWNAAFEMTCKKLDIMWLYTYYQTLAWYESDKFDSDIYTLLMTKFINVDTPDNKYYQYLLDKSDRDATD